MYVCMYVCVFMYVCIASGIYAAAGCYFPPSLHYDTITACQFGMQYT